MGKYTFELKLRLAYFEFKKRAAIILSIWTLAFVAGIGLIIASEFIVDNYAVKIGSVILAFLLWSRVIYDVWKELREEYVTKFRAYDYKTQSKGESKANFE